MGASLVALSSRDHVINANKCTYRVQYGQKCCVLMTDAPQAGAPVWRRDRVAAARFEPENDSSRQGAGSNVGELNANCLSRQRRGAPLLRSRIAQTCQCARARSPAMSSLAAISEATAASSG